MTAAVRAKLWDVASAAPMIGWFGLVLAVSASNLVLSGESGVTIEKAAQGASILFAALLIVLFLVRRTPVVAPQGWIPRAVGLAGGLAPMLMLALPPGRPSPTLLAISSGVIFVGTLLSIIVALWLGRCFAILPAARGLVTSGPYRLVRHPLYFAEILTLFGLMLQFAQPWGLLGALCAAAAQVPRMIYEERELAAAFPAYAAYAARTARLLPGVY